MPTWIKGIVERGRIQVEGGLHAHGQLGNRHGMDHAYGAFVCCCLATFVHLKNKNDLKKIPENIQHQTWSFNEQKIHLPKHVFPAHDRIQNIPEHFK